MNISEFLKALKAPLYFTSISPVLIGWAFSSFRISYLVILLLIVTVSMQAGMNLAMDYFDHNSRRPLRNEDTFFPLGSLFIEKYRVNPARMRVSFLTMMLVAVVAGLIVVYITRDLILLYFGLFGVFISLLYVIPPIKLGARGIGELSTFFSFGPLAVIGTIIAVGGRVSDEAIFVSVSLGLLASAIRYLHHIPEDNPDGRRVRYFKVIYPILVIGAPIMISIFRNIEIPALIVFAGALIHVAYLPRQPIQISRKTNISVLIHFGFTVLVLVFLALKL
ncbi:MAG: prenyltransferase [Thermoplasmatales archaeon]